MEALKPSQELVGRSSAVMLSASEYVEELELDAEDEEKIVGDLQLALEAWCEVVGGEAETVDMSVDAAVRDEDDGVICRLVTRLKTTYCAEKHGSELRRVAAASTDKPDHLCMAGFADWFVRWLHAPDSFSDEESAADKEVKAVKESVDSLSPNRGMWSNTT